MWPSAILQRWGRLSVTQPLSQPVYANDEAYLQHTGVEKLGWRHFRRLVYFRMSGQASRCTSALPHGSARGLWLYRGVPQIGDALMDLAPRSLLKEVGISVDLYTEPHLAALFVSDPYFKKVMASPGELKESAYDFVIVPSNKRRSLKDKAAHLSRLPWLSMHGFYTGPEFHRAKFATQRLLDALDMQADAQTFSLHARQKLSPLPTSARSIGSPFKIGIAVGGVDPLRSYEHWQQVAELLARQFNVHLTLLGTENGQTTARRLASLWPERVSNQVGRTTLAQCRKLIHEQDIFISCDGGLMHLAITTATRLVSLFQSSVDPHWRLPEDALDGSLQSHTLDVNDIQPSRVVQKIVGSFASCAVA